ncbi:hypothetical protein MP638_001357 [Amoeboaphelidium occidentale]|nr:hypothetical protein MP638_001357 [Amoeboaphelidium occidentale]
MDRFIQTFCYGILLWLLPTIWVKVFSARPTQAAQQTRADVVKFILGGQAVLIAPHGVRALLGTEVPLEQLLVMIMGSVWSIIVNPLENLSNKAYRNTDVLFRNIKLFQNTGQMRFSAGKGNCRFDELRGRLLDTPVDIKS